MVEARPLPGEGLLGRGPQFKKGGLDALRALRPRPALAILKTCLAFRTERCPYPRGARAPGHHNFGQPPTDWGWPSAGWT
eukprot:3190108-Alexandrium_andersonii.AAC.1